MSAPDPSPAARLLADVHRVVAASGGRLALAISTRSAKRAAMAEIAADLEKAAKTLRELSGER